MANPKDITVYQKALDDVYQAAYKTVQDRKTVAERSVVKNNMFRQSLNEKDPEVAKRIIASSRLADMADLIRSRVQSLKWVQDDNEVVYKAFSSVNWWQKMLADYLNWDISIYEKLSGGKSMKSDLMWRVSNLDDSELSKLMGEYNSVKDNALQKVPKGKTILWKLWNAMKWEYVDSWTSEEQGFAQFINDSQKTFKDVALDDLWLAPDVVAWAWAGLAQSVANVASFLAWIVSPVTGEKIKNIGDIEDTLKAWWLADTSMFDAAKFATELWLSVTAAEWVLWAIKSIGALEKFAKTYPKWNKYLVRPVVGATTLGEWFSIIGKWELEKDPVEIAKFAALDLWLSTAWAIKNAVSPNVRDLLNKAITPTVIAKSKNVKWLQKFEENTLDAVSSVIKNKESLQFLDGKSGEIISWKTPSSVLQFAEALDQTKNTIYKMYQSLEWWNATLKVDTSKMVEGLRSSKAIKWLEFASPGISKYIDKMINNIEAMGDIDVSDAARIMKSFSTRVRLFMKDPKPNDVSKAVVDNWLARELRSSLNSTMQNALGWWTLYQDLKKRYWAIVSIEQEVNKAAIKIARRKDKSISDFIDVFNAWDLAYGLINANPGAIAKWAVWSVLKSIYKRMNDPDRNIKKLFDIIEGKMKKKWPIEWFNTAVKDQSDVVDDTLIQLNDLQDQIGR